MSQMLTSFTSSAIPVGLNFSYSSPSPSTSVFEIYFIMRDVQSLGILVLYSFISTLQLLMSCVQ